MSKRDNLIKADFSFPTKALLIITVLLICVGLWVNAVFYLGNKPAVAGESVVTYEVAQKTLGFDCENVEDKKGLAKAINNCIDLAGGNAVKTCTVSIQSVSCKKQSVFYRVMLVDGDEVHRSKPFTNLEDLSKMGGPDAKLPEAVVGK